MTSFAFIPGCVPLAQSSAAGALSRQIMGFAVIGGMLAATFIAVFIILALHFMIGKIGARKVAAARSKSLNTSSPL